MGRLIRPSAKSHAEIVAQLEGSNKTLRLACDRWAEGWKVAKAKHDEAIKAMKADIKTIETSRDSVGDIAVDRLGKLEAEKKAYLGVKRGYSIALAELHVYRQLLKGVVRCHAEQEIELRDLKKK